MSVYGAEGYGWFWIILEIMAQEENGRISVAKKYDIPSLASSLPNCSTDKCREFIDDCINEFELFKTDGNEISSNRLDRDLKFAFKKSENGTKAAYARWAKAKKKDEVPFPEEEKKDVPPEKIKRIQVLQDDKLFLLFAEQLRKQDDFKDFTDKYLQSERHKCLDWGAAKGVVKKDYKAFFRNWLRNNADPVAQVEPEKKKRQMYM